MSAEALFDVCSLAVLVAGGAGGLGAALARALHRRGAQVTVGDLGARADALAGDGIRGCALDILDPASCAAAVDAARAPDGRIDAVVNAAGVFRTAPALELELEDWQRTIAANLTGAFVLAKAAGRAMVPQGRGRILTLASVSSQVANPDYAAYAAGKAGVVQLTRVLALEWAAAGVTVNAIGPAMTETDLTRAFLDAPDRRAAALARIPAGRLATPEDIVGTAIFLLSPAAAFVTGQILYVDGGRTLS